MYKHLFYIFTLINVIVSYSQNSIDVKVKSVFNHKAIENVLISNMISKTYSYSKNNGLGKILFSSKEDSILFSIPGYEKKIFNITEIENLNNKVFLRPKPELLDEVLIKAKKEPEHNYKFIRKKKKKYYSKLVSSNAAIVSTYRHKKNKEYKLQGISFYFDNETLSNNELLFIRPIIFEYSDKLNLSILENPNVIELDRETKKIIIDLSNQNIYFKNKTLYLIGFQLVNKNDVIKVISIRVLNPKKEYSLIKSSPNGDWFKQDNSGNGFSIDFELFF